MELNLDEISRRISDCVIASAWVKPETQITDTPELYKLLNPVAPYEFLNGIYRTQFPTGRADQLVREHQATFRDKKISFRWYVFPHSTPSDLHDRIRSFKPSGVTEMQGLFAQAKGFNIAVARQVSVEELSAKNIDEYAAASNEGWGQTGAQAEKIRNDIKRDFENGGMPYRSFLARFDGEPAGTAILRLVGESGYLLGTSVRPQFRKKGVYRGLVNHRLEILENDGIQLALILARKDTSAPICKNLGFQIACEPVCYNFRF
jgi:GNAT superfamily N-acetyltransferase